MIQANKGIAILVLYLAGISACAALLVSANDHRPLLLGWHVNPGGTMVFLVLATCLIGFWRTRNSKALIVPLLILAVCLSEYLPFSRDIWTLTGSVLITLAAYGNYKLNESSRMVFGAFCLLLVYAQAVFFYDALHPQQGMYFFLSGWTA
jgi:hypothetical protein